MLYIGAAVHYGEHMKRSEFQTGAVYRLRKSRYDRVVFATPAPYWADTSPSATWPYKSRQYGTMFAPIPAAELPTGARTLDRTESVPSRNVESLAAAAEDWPTVRAGMEAAGQAAEDDRARRYNALALILAAAMADGRDVPAPGGGMFGDDTPITLLIGQLRARNVTTGILEWLAARVGTDGSATIAQQNEANRWIKERYQNR